MSKIIEVEINDRFVKTQYAETVWMVQKVVGLTELPRHYQLKAVNKRRGTLTMSESALMDRALFTRVEAA